MVSLNLIPENQQRRDAQRERCKQWLPIVLAAAFGLGVSLLYDRATRAQAAETRTRNERLQAQLDSTRKQVRTATLDAQNALAQLERANAMRGKRRWSAMLAMIAERQPHGCWLTSIRTDPATPLQSRTRKAKEAQPSNAAAPALGLPPRSSSAPAAPTAPVPVVLDAPRALRISGFATTPAEPHAFVAQLKETSLFTRVELESVLREPAFDGFYFKFELECEW